MNLKTVTALLVFGDGVTLVVNFCGSNSYFECHGTGQLISAFHTL